MKKILTLMLATLMLVGMIAGCAPAAQPVQETAAAEQSASKTITVDVVTEESTKSVEIQTDEGNLGRAMVNHGLVEDNPSDFGLYILTADGITADESKQEWWCITKGGEELMTGADDTPIADGDKFELTLKVGY